MELRRSPTAPDSRPKGKQKNEFALNWRQDLDSNYSFLTNPYTAWRAKRQSIESRIAKNHPDYTQGELEKTYEALGLGVSTDPGSFSRDPGLLGMGSRAMSKSANMFGMLKDSWDMWSDSDDMENVKTQQQELEEQVLENQLIDKFQKSTAYGKNVVTQFLFDLASSAPIMVGIMGAGTAIGSVATLAGAPVWLAGLLGMGVADSLSEMGFNFADIMTNPMVRKKIEDALNVKLNDADIDTIAEETQRLLMEEADTSMVKVGIGNFMNPLNWVPQVNKLSKLMKVGSGRMGTIGRQALGTGIREGVEEFAQSVGSQYTAGEAQMRAMGRAGVEDIPDMDVDFNQAGYEALMGFVVGGGIGGGKGSHDFSKYFDPDSNFIDVDADGNPIIKKPNEKGFKGAGSLRMNTRKMVDQNDPVLLNDWLNGVDEDGKYNLDKRERDIILDELGKMKANEGLLGDKTSPEKRAQRQENAKEFEKFLISPEAWQEWNKTAEEKAEDTRLRDEAKEEETLLEEEEAAELAAAEALAPVEVWEERKDTGTKILHMVNKEAEAMVRKVLRVAPKKRTPRQKEFLILAHANPDKTYKELAKMQKEEESGDSFLFGKPKPVTPLKTGGADATVTQAVPGVAGQAGTPTVGEVVTPVVTQPEVTVGEDTTLTPVLQQMLNKVENLTERLRLAEGGEPTVTTGEQQATTLNPAELALSPAADEIVNTLKSWVGQDKKAKDWDGMEGTWENLRGKLYNPLKELGRPLNDESTKIKSGKNKGKERTEYFISPSIRLAKLNELAAQLGIARPVAQPTATVDTATVDADVVEDTAEDTVVDTKTKYNKPYNESGDEIEFAHPLDHLATLVNTEVVKIRPKTQSLRYKHGLTFVSAKHKGGESTVRTSVELVSNPAQGITRLRFMGFNKDGVPYFNDTYVREDRTGSTRKGATVDQKEIIDPGAVTHLLSGQSKTLVGVNEVGEGKKLHKEADASYATVTDIAEVAESEQAKSIQALLDDVTSYELEYDEVDTRIKGEEDAGIDPLPEDIARRDELAELIGSVVDEIEELKLGAKEKGVPVKEGRERQEFVPFNAMGLIQKDINSRQSNLRKKLKKKQQGENKGRADITTQAEVDLTLTRIETVFGWGDLVMDREYGVQVGEEINKSITSLRMRKTTPIDTSTLEYALRINGWELVNTDMNGLIDNEIEVKVGVNEKIKGVPKYIDDIIGKDGINHSQRERDLSKLLNLETENALKRRRDEWTGTKVGLEGWERAYYNRQVEDAVLEADIEAYEGTLITSEWKKSARKWFTSPDSRDTPPITYVRYRVLSTPDAIKMVRQQMKALPDVTNKSVDATTDAQILEFLWAGPGQNNSPTLSPVLYDSTNPDHKGFDVDAKFKNGDTATIVGMWSKSLPRLKALAKEIANSNAQEVKPPPSGKKGTGKKTTPPVTKVETADVNPSSKTLTKEEVQLHQDLANRQAKKNEETIKAQEAADAADAAAAETTTEEVITPPEESTGVNELALINVEKGGELQSSMPPADAKEYGSARFDKLRKIPKYRDASLWDASDIDIDPDNPSLALTNQIKTDLGIKLDSKAVKDRGVSGKKSVTDLIRRKLQDYLVLEIQTTEDVEGLKAEIDIKYWDLLVGAGHTAINKALKDRSSSKIDRGNKKTPSTSKKKDEKLATELLPGFITDNVASATITGIPTANPKLNDVWVINPDETNDLFLEEASKSEKNLEELDEFLALTNNGDFFVVKKSADWSKAYILLRGDFGQATKGKGGKKIPVPQAIRTRLSREGKFFNAQREDFPLDQHSRKLTREDITNTTERRKYVDSEQFMQLFRSESIDINLLQKALDEDRIIWAYDVGLDNSIEVTWKNKDGTIVTNGLDNIGVMTFKNRSQIEAFVEHIRKLNPDGFARATKQWEIMKSEAAAKARGLKGEIEGIFDEATTQYGSNAGITSVEDGLEPISYGVDPSNVIDEEGGATLPGHEHTQLEEIAAEDWFKEEGKERRSWLTAYDDKKSYDYLTAKSPDKTLRQQIQEEYRERNRREEEGLSEELGRWEDMNEAEKEAWRLKYFRLSEDPPEGAIPASLEVVTNIVEKFRKQFPGSANIVIATDKSLEFKGVYSPKNNTIYIVANEHYSEKDVVQTLWHEGIGHGIQNIITAEEFLELQQLVETHMPERFTEELDLINKDKNFNELTYSEKSSIAAQEVIADFANDLEGQNATVIESITTWLRKVYNSFAKALDFKQLDLTEGDVRALLSETADAFRKPRDTGRASDYVVDTMTPEIDTSLQRRTTSTKKSSFDNTNLPEADRAIWDKIHGGVDEAPTGSWWKRIRQSLAFTIADPYAIVKDEIGPTQYMVSRLAGRADGIITTLLKYTGVLVKQRDVNGVTVNETVLNPKMKGLFTMLKPLGTEHERKQFFAWVAFKRADILMKDNRESFFSKDEIEEGLKWNQGRIKNAATGTIVSREVLYNRIQKDVAAMNNSVVQFGVKMGLLSKTSADNFEKDFYVPFYRIMEEDIGDGKNGNPVDYDSLTGQAGVKRLKGSSKPIGDVFNNLLHNWLHIIDASVKNDAANTTIRAALEIKNPMDSSQMLVESHVLPTNYSNTVRVKQDGVEKRFNVNHDLLYKSLTALSTDTKFPGFKHAIAAKGLFTKIVTSNPIFKYNNIIRDTLTTAGTTDIGYNLIKNAGGGMMALKEYQAQMLVSGGYIQFAYTRGDDASYAETLLNKELATGYIVNNPETDNAFLSALKKANKMGRNLLDQYNKIGDKLENANRAALFKSLLLKGKSQTEAAFEARDIMDFTLHGGADWVKLVTSLTPFANAMIQGKYKFGRAIINNPKPVAIVGGMVVLASLFEAMMHEDDEEWQNRPDWDKDTFWEVKLPGSDIIWKIPKPHEFALLGNMSWRALDMAKGKDPDYGGALVSGIKTLVSREFGIVPIPQIVKPFVEVAMNRNLFFDRDIEPVGSGVRSPSKRYGQYTSETSILASQLLENIPLDTLKLSPYQLEHLIHGYFGWWGQTVLGVADYITSTTGDFPERPARELSDHPMARRVFKSSPLRNTKSGTIFYERLKELEQSVQDMNLAKKYGHMDDYQDIYDDKKDILKFKAFIRKKGRMVNDLNARIKRIRFDKRMGGEEKATRIDRLYQLRNDLLSRVAKTPAFR